MSATPLPSDSPKTLGPPSSPGPVTAARQRLDSIDLLRGAVMVLMALDHVRDFLGRTGLNPRDVTQPAVFLTRWITHFCAPTFVFLAGVSAFLYGTRGRTPAQVSRFLVTRGVWLVVLELTIVRTGWTFRLNPDFVALQVIWVIGCSMIALAGLIHVPRVWLAVFSLALIFGHHLLDRVQPSDWGAGGWVWSVLHVMGMIEPWPGRRIFVLYPLVPWVGLLAAGYVFGPTLLLPAESRRRRAIAFGLGAMGLFVVLRASGVYGDPVPWTLRERWGETLLAFLDCEKYPPSLLFLCMTMAPGLLVLGCVERVSGRFGRVLVTFGRVPMLYYVAHIYAAHALAVGYAVLAGEDPGPSVGDPPGPGQPAASRLGLPGVYLAWVMLVALLYPLCRWFAELKQRRRDWWLSYL